MYELWETILPDFNRCLKEALWANGNAHRVDLSRGSDSFNYMHTAFCRITALLS